MDKLFLSIATFLFAIFSGFFISRQGTRYSAIREQISKMDGNMSAIYRVSGHLGADVQKRAGEIIEEHYKPILENRAWDWNLTHKSTTLTSIHRLIEEKVRDEKLPQLANGAMMQILGALREMQVVRKSMVALREERISESEWLLIYFLAAILLVILASVPSQYSLVPSILKAAFSASLLFVIALLRQLANLKSFEGTIGEHSAQDILMIIKGER